MEGSNPLFTSVGLEVGQNHFLNEEPGSSGSSIDRIHSFGHQVIHGFAGNHLGEDLGEPKGKLEWKEIGSRSLEGCLSEGRVWESEGKGSWK